MWSHNFLNWNKKRSPPIFEEEEIPLVETDTETEAEVSFGPTLRRSTRARRPTARYQQYLEQRNLAFAAEMSEAAEVDEAYYDALHEDDYRIHVLDGRRYDVFQSSYESPRQAKFR
jgi:hypothetical protein